MTVIESRGLTGILRKTGSHREAVYEEGLRSARQDRYDVREYEAVPWVFKDGGERNVYKNFNLSVFVDELCNADCPFCVSLLRYEHKSLIYAKQKISSDAEYEKRLYEVLEAIRPLNPSVSVTGGEPTILPRTYIIAKALRELGFRKKTITSNGSGLFRPVGGHREAPIDALLEAGFDHLNISRAHWDDAENARIMRYKRTVSDTSLAHLARILSYLEGERLAPRISCILLREGVGTVGTMKTYLDVLREVGARNFIFRELMDYDRNAVNLPMMRYMDENKVRLNDLWGEIDDDASFRRVLNILGYYYYVEVYRYRDCTVASESADLSRQYTEKDDNPDMVYEMVLHENGNLCGSWIETEDILDRYDGYHDRGASR
ncbi:radical SAM protein [Arachnia rubra]|jgi:probable molybdenum cofactor biosynthesis protein A|uniref:Radical SAM protein n=1 Tax=Arachnia rubra TaxID=1547448 RepID=A0ABX7Y2F7_9ACTN|nr:radical SAM protein [Arachnia rubra]MBB1570240.1 radical SAM protein [Propionibacterium sp.]MDO4644733.1 radical SAM protein [Propionibacteriaceae bacterium]QUC07344.1 radical SAM protein [Arachnia rubra]